MLAADVWRSGSNEPPCKPLTTQPQAAGASGGALQGGAAWLSRQGGGGPRPHRHSLRAHRSRDESSSSPRSAHTGSASAGLPPCPQLQVLCVLRGRWPRSGRAQDGSGSWG